MLPIVVKVTGLTFDLHTYVGSQDVPNGRTKVFLIREGQLIVAKTTDNADTVGNVVLAAVAAQP